MSHRNCTDTKSSETARVRAERAIALLSAQLSETELAERIDLPIDKALMQFPFEVATPTTVRQLHGIITEFLKHVSIAIGSHVASFPDRWVCNEAVRTMAQSFQDTNADAYDSALREVFDQSHAGVRVAVERMSQLLRDCKEITGHFESPSPTLVVWTLIRYKKNTKLSRQH